MKSLQNLPAILALVGVIALFTACNDEETPGTDQTTGFKYQVKMDNQTASINARVAANEINFSSGTMRVNEIDFEAERENEETEFEREHPTTIDLMTGEAEPPLPIIEITPGVYEEIEFGVSLDDDEGDSALVIEGNYINSNDEEVPFRFEYNQAFEFEVEFDDNVTIEENNTFLAILQLIPSKWFQQVSLDDLENASTNDNGVLVINASENTGIYDKLIAGLESENDDMEVELDFDYDDDDDDDNDN